MAPSAPDGRVTADLEAVRRAQGGDRAAFGRLWKDHAAAVHGVLLSMVEGEAVADLMQETSLAALRAIASLNDPGRFAAWLLSIARNKARDHRNDRRPEVRLPDDVCSTAHTAPDDGDQGARILALIRGLPEAYREALVLRLVEGFSGPEISERTGLTPGSVRVNLCRGMKLLRAQMEREHLT
jgi:RNA polymerase sigma-70 factor, ECF subfamily